MRHARAHTPVRPLTACVLAVVAGCPEICSESDCIDNRCMVSQSQATTFGDAAVYLAWTGTGSDGTFTSKNFLPSAYNKYSVGNIADVGKAAAVCQRVGVANAYAALAVQCHNWTWPMRCETTLRSNNKQTPAAQPSSNPPQQRACVPRCCSVGSFTVCLRATRRPASRCPAARGFC